MKAHIIALLQLFKGFMPDQESAAWILELASNEVEWRRAHHLFQKIRMRNLQASESRNSSLECQYCFEEACLKALYNESGPYPPFSSDSPAPFDSDSPYWIVPLAIDTARQFRLPEASVIDIIAPR